MNFHPGWPILHVSSRSVPGRVLYRIQDTARCAGEELMKKRSEEERGEMVPVCLLVLGRGIGAQRLLQSNHPKKEKEVKQHANDACFSPLETRKQGVGREWRHRGCDSVEWCDLHGSGRPAVVSRVSCPPWDDRSGLYGYSIHQLCAGVGGEEDWVG